MSAEHLIYGTEASPFVRKVLVFMAEKGIAWQLQEVNVFDPPTWFSALSPAKRIPVLQDTSLPGAAEATSLADSSAICGYLERKVADPALYPENAMEYGRALWFEEYADTLLAARIGFGLLRTLVVAPRNGEPADLNKARKALHQDLPPLFDYLEQAVGHRQWLVGEQISIADIAIGAQLAGLRVTRVTLDSERWPNLSRYSSALFERPSFAARLAAVAHLSPASPPEL